MQKENPEISIVIPVFNEGDHIRHSLLTIDKEICRVTDSYELILIDDGSSDHTWEELELLCSQLPRLLSFRLSRNFGKEMALCAGLEHASGRAVIVMDSDLQHPPALLGQMIDLWRNERKEVVECVKSERGKETIDKALGSTLFYKLLNTLSGFDLMGASDYKLMDRKVVQAWMSLPERRTFFRGMLAWLGYEREQIYFEVPERSNGSSRWSILSLMKLAVSAIVSFSSIPLRFVSVCGLLFLFGAVLLGIQTLYQYFIGNAMTGFTTVILLLLIIGSVIMISLGIIGEYIAAMYHEVKGRPRYLIRERRVSFANRAMDEVRSSNWQAAAGQDARQ